MSLDMSQRYRRFRRRWGTYYAFDNQTGNSISLKTQARSEADRKLAAMNEAALQPQINLHLARVYLSAADPKLATRTWQEVMDLIVSQRHDSTKARWLVAIRDKAFDCIRNLKVAETRPEHFLEALDTGKVATNVYLRRIHNHALGMDWLLKPVIPRLQWPKPIFKEKRAISAEEHQAIIEREANPERRDFYELLWLTGAAQGDASSLLAEDVDWERRTICYTRKKLRSKGSRVAPALFRFGAATEEVLKRRPAKGPLFPYLCTVRTNDRATEFHQRCESLGIKGVSLHSYRYAWAERAKTCGYPERFAQEALGHNSKAVHRAYARGAQVKLPSLEEYELAHAASNIIPLKLQTGVLEEAAPKVHGPVEAKTIEPATAIDRNVEANWESGELEVCAI